VLFRWGQFKSAAGLDLDWRIECDALTDDDWSCIAMLARRIVEPFSRVEGVPRGGFALAKAMSGMCSSDPDLRRVLVVDDVWTTGLSMHRYTSDWPHDSWRGFVVFARGIDLPPWVRCLCKINSQHS
jgi:hypothetical protein